MAEQIQHPQHTTRFVESETCPSTAVIQSTAAFLGRDPIELEPLGEAIDTDALDSLFLDCSHVSEGGTSGTVRFEYHGVDVRISFEDDSTYAVGLSERTA